MSLRTLLISLVLGASSLSAAPEADAQEWSINARRSSRHGSINVSFGGGRDYGSRQSNGRYGRVVRTTRSNRVECAPPRQWVPGHYDWVEEQIWVPGRTRREWVPAVYETRYDDCGNPYRVLVCAGYYHTVQEPGYYRTQRRKVWHDGYWR